MTRAEILSWLDSHVPGLSSRSRENLLDFMRLLEGAGKPLPTNLVADAEQNVTCVWGVDQVMLMYRNGQRKPILWTVAHPDGCTCGFDDVWEALDGVAPLGGESLLVIKDALLGQSPAASLQGETDEEDGF